MQGGRFATTALEELRKASLEELEEFREGVDDFIEILRSLCEELEDISEELREASHIAGELVERIMSLPDELVAWAGGIANILSWKEMDIHALANELSSMLRLLRLALGYLEGVWRLEERGQAQGSQQARR